MRAHSVVGLVCLLVSFPGLAEELAPLTLNDLLKAALEHDGRVMAAHAQLDSYRAQYKEAWLSWFPVINFEAGFGGPVGERRLTCPPDALSGDVCLHVTGNRQNVGVSGQTSFAVGGKIETTVPLYTFGKLSAAKDAASAGVEAGTAGIAQARQEVALEVRRAYYGWSLAKAAIEILEDGEEKLKEAEEKLQKMLEEMNEDVTDQDEYKLRYYSTQVTTMLLQARQGQNVALAALRFLTGIEDLGNGRALTEQNLSATTNFTPEKRDEYIARAIRNRPDLKMLSAGLDATKAQVDLAKAYYYPDIALQAYFKGSYSPVQEYISNPLLQQGQTNYDGGLLLGLRLTLDYPQKIARLHRAEADYAKLQAQLDQARAALGLEIDKRLEELKMTTDFLVANRKGSKAAKSWMRANMMSYGVGVSNTKDLLDSLVAYAQSQMELDKAAHDSLVSLDQLLMAVGEDLDQTK